jgi:transcriptional regulator with XRE-family HTH domain
MHAINPEISDLARRVLRMAPDRATRLKHWGQTLKDRINEKELNQSEFASRVAIFTRDRRMGRDLISNYTRGISEPSPLKQTAMAKALGISVEELMAPMGIVAPSKEKTVSPVEMKSVSPTSARLKIDTELPWGIAVEILRLISSTEK